MRHVGVKEGRAMSIKKKIKGPRGPRMMYGGRPEKVAEVKIKKEPGYLYFVDKDGDVARAKMARGGRKKKKKR